MTICVNIQNTQKFHDERGQNGGKNPIDEKMLFKGKKERTDLQTDGHSGP